MVRVPDLDSGCRRFESCLSDIGEKKMSYFAVGLYNPKTPENVGGVLRAMHIYGGAMIAKTGQRYRKHPTDAIKSYRHIPLIQVEDLKEVIPFQCVPVAVELLENATSLITYKHPKRAFYIFGPEDGSLGEKVTSWCKDIIYIPTKFCMNLAATVNVVLYDRLAKSMRTENE